MRRTQGSRFGDKTLIKVMRCSAVCAVFAPPYIVICTRNFRRTRHEVNHTDRPGS